MKIYLGVEQKPEWGNSQWDTEQVANHLEESYDLFSAYVDNKKEKIANHLSSGIEQAIANIVAGKPYKRELNNSVAVIGKDLKNFINTKEAENLLAPGKGKYPVPSQAALDGKSKKRSKPYAKGARRPTFVDSGIFVGSIKSWVEE